VIATFKTLAQHIITRQFIIDDAPLGPSRLSVALVVDNIAGEFRRLKSLTIYAIARSLLPWGRRWAPEIRRPDVGNGCMSLAKRAVRR